jgi:hypothetical protein
MCLVAASSSAAVPLVQINATTYKTEHCLFVIDSSVTWSSPTTAYNDLYAPGPGPIYFPKLKGYFDTLTTQFPGNYFSVCYIANTGDSHVPNYIDRAYKATGISNGAGSAGIGSGATPGTYDAVDLCRYNLSGGNVVSAMLGVYDHEIGHAWGAQIFNSLNPPMLANGHWLPNSTVDCQLGSGTSSPPYLTVDKIYGDPTNGFRWQHVDNGRSNDFQVFSEQQLYLMGLQPTFPTSYVLNSPVFNADFTMSYSSVDTFDHQAAVATYGVRNPDYKTAPKKFKLGFVYVAHDVAELNTVYQNVEQSITSFCSDDAISSTTYRGQTPFLCDARYRASADGLLADLDGNTTPTLAVTNGYVASTDGTATVAFVAGDPDGTSPSVAIVPASTHCTISGGNVTVSGLPDGVHFFTLKCTDAGNKRAYDHFVVEVHRPVTTTAISSQPVGQTSVAGNSATFTVTASGSPSPLTYRWYRAATKTSTWNALSNGGAYSGADTAALTVATTPAMDGDHFLCFVSNSTGTATSASAALTVNETVASITSQPADQSIISAASTYFRVTVGGANTFGYYQYQWQRLAAGTSTWTDVVSSSTYNGPTNYQLTLYGSTLATDGDQFRCVVSNTAGAVTSTVAILHVGVVPQITTQPVPITSTVGQTVSFTAAAAGTAPLAYQWSKFGTVVGHSATLTLTNIQTSDAGTYGVNVTNAFGLAYSNNVELTVNPAAPTAPVITVQPVAQSVTTGGTTSFSVAASGTAPLSYAWRKNGAPIPGATTTNLSVNNAQSSDAADYTVVITNSVGTVTSAAATLTVAAVAVAPTISSQPVAQSVAAGQNVFFTVTASGTAPLTYQWRRNGTALPGATSATWSIASAQVSDAADYSVVVTNSVGSVTSASATLTVLPAPLPPTLVSGPQPVTVTAGQNASFTVSISSPGPFVYQWQKNGASLGGANSPTLTINTVQTSDAGDYQVLVSNAAGSVTSAAAHLTVTSAQVVPVITAQPTSLTVTSGATATFTVTASGATSYAWRFNGASIPGGTSATLALANVQTANVGRYSVVVSNAAGSTTSADAMLSVSTLDLSGSYFGSFGSDHKAGDFALLVKSDGRVSLVARFAASPKVVVATDVVLHADGTFSVGMPGAALVSQPGGASRFYGGEIQGQLDGTRATLTVPGLNLSGSTPRLTGGHAQASQAGIYEALPVGASAGEVYLVVGEGGEAFLLGLGATSSRSTTGALAADGTLQLTIAPGSASASMYSGSLASGALEGAVTTSTGTILLAPIPSIPGKQRLANISTRGIAGSADKTMIAGFVITGAEGKDVLIRALGPALADLGVAGTLGNPKLSVLHGSTTVLENDDWSSSGFDLGSTAARLGAFPLTAGSKDAALLVHLAPGLYSAQVSIGAAAPGVVIVEVYDAGTTESTAPKLVNISTRTEVGRGDNILIAGFVITGDAPKKVLLRAIGPTLATYGVNGALLDPMITLFHGGTTMKVNDNWGDEDDSALIESTAAGIGAAPLPSGSKDAALLIYLQPGVYSAHVRGVGDTTGIALVEVYEVSD